MNSSETLKDMTIRKISDCIDKYIDLSSKVRVTFNMDGNMKHIYCGITTADGDSLHAEGASENVFSAIDIITQKLESQLQRRKNKIKSRNKLRWNTVKLEKLLANTKAIIPESDDSEVIDAADIIKFEAAWRPLRARLMH